MKFPNISFIYSFSLIVFLLNIFHYNTRINNALYLCNTIALFGCCIMILVYPNFFYKKYNWLIPLNQLWFNMLLVFFHILPLFLFIDKNHINKNNIVNVIKDSILVMLLYLFIFHNLLKYIYPFTIFQLFFMSLSILIFIYIFFILSQLFYD
jgi:hypothetical protein